MRLFILFLLLSTASVFAETDVQFFFANQQYGLTQTTNRLVTLQGVNYSQAGIYTLLNFQASGYTDTNGQITFSNLDGSAISGYYRVVVPYTPIGGQTWNGYIWVQSTNLGLINANTIFYNLGPATIPQSGSAWTAQTSDARYAAIGTVGGSSTNAVVTNKLSQTIFGSLTASNFSGVVNQSLQPYNYVGPNGADNFYIGTGTSYFESAQDGVMQWNNGAGVGGRIDNEGYGIDMFEGNSAGVSGSDEIFLSTNAAIYIENPQGIAIVITNLNTFFLGNATVSGIISGLGTGITGLPVSGISASGTANNTTYLRGDGSWQTVSGGSGGTNLFLGSGNTNDIQVLTNTAGVSYTLYGGPNLVRTNPASPQTIYAALTLTGAINASGSGTTPLTGANVTGTVPAATTAGTATDAVWAQNATNAVWATNAYNAALSSNVVSGIQITNANLVGNTTGNGNGLTNLNGPFTMPDGSISNWYQLHSIIPPQLLATIDGFWSNNPTTSFYNPLTGNDATAVAGNWLLPSATITNAVALATTNNGCIYYEIPGSIGNGPSSFFVYKSLTWILNGGSLQPMPSHQDILLVCKQSPTYFIDGMLSNIEISVNNQAPSPWVVEKYIFHNNFYLSDVFNTSGLMSEFDNSIIIGNWDIFHGVRKAIIKDSYVYSDAVGGSDANCVYATSSNDGFLIKNSIVVVNGALAWSVALWLNASNSVGVIINSDIYSTTNLPYSSTNGTIIVNGQNAVVMNPDTYSDIPTNQISLSNGGAYVNSSSFTLTNLNIALSQVFTNNSITSATIDGDCYLTNGSSGLASITFYDTSSGMAPIVVSLPNIASINQAIPFHVNINAGDSYYFTNSSIAGTGTAVGLQASPTLHYP